MSSPTFVIVCLFEANHCDGYGAVSHCVLICISLMISIFLCWAFFHSLLAIWTSFFTKMYIQVFCPFLKWVVHLLVCCWCWGYLSSLYIWDINILLDISFATVLDWLCFPVLEKKPCLGDALQGLMICCPLILRAICSRGAPYMDCVGFSAVAGLTAMDTVAWLTARLCRLW